MKHIKNKTEVVTERVIGSPEKSQGNTYSYMSNDGTTKLFNSLNNYNSYPNPYNSGQDNNALLGSLPLRQDTENSNYSQLTKIKEATDVISERVLS